MPIQLYCRRHLGALGILDSQGVVDVGRLAHHLRTCPICSRSHVRAQKLSFGSLVTTSLPSPSVLLKYRLPPASQPSFVADQASPAYSPDLNKVRISNLPQDRRSLPGPAQRPDPPLEFQTPIQPAPAIDTSLTISDRIYLKFWP